jgi:hypothetical protein
VFLLSFVLEKECEEVAFEAATVAFREKFGLRCKPQIIEFPSRIGESDLDCYLERVARTYTMVRIGMEIGPVILCRSEFEEGLELIKRGAGPLAVRQGRLEAAHGLRPDLMLVWLNSGDSPQNRIRLIDEMQQNHWAHEVASFETPWDITVSVRAVLSVPRTSPIPEASLPAPVLPVA